MPPPVAFSSRSRSYLLRKDRAQRAAGYEPLEGDVQWTPRSTLLYPALCTFAGLCAGVFGVGGGIVKVNMCRCLTHGLNFSEALRSVVSTGGCLAWAAALSR